MRHFALQGVSRGQFVPTPNCPILSSNLKNSPSSQFTQTPLILNDAPWDKYENQLMNETPHIPQAFAGPATTDFLFGTHLPNFRPKWNPRILVRRFVEVALWKRACDLFCNGLPLGAEESRRQVGVNERRQSAHPLGQNELFPIRTNAGWFLGCFKPVRRMR